MDQAPTQVCAALLDEDRYLCSVRTMYRILDANQEVRERRNQRRHPVYQKPELLATGPNEVWTWDITKLKGPRKWTYYYLYVILDIFSRQVVGWMVADCESASLAKKLIRESCLKQRIDRDQLILHADRGSSMKSKVVAQYLPTLGLAQGPVRGGTRPGRGRIRSPLPATIQRRAGHSKGPACHGGSQFGGELLGRFHQSFSSGSELFRGIPSSEATFFWITMTVSACASLASSRRFLRSSSAIRLSRASGGFPFRPRLAGRNPSSSPASRCRRHVLKADENNPSRRSNAPNSPGFVHRSASRPAL